MSLDTHSGLALRGRFLGLHPRFLKVGRCHAWPCSRSVLSMRSSLSPPPIARVATCASNPLRSYQPLTFVSPSCILSKLIFGTLVSILNRKSDVPPLSHILKRHARQRATGSLHHCAFPLRCRVGPRKNRYCFKCKSSASLCLSCRVTRRTGSSSRKSLLLFSSHHTFEGRETYVIT